MSDIADKVAALLRKAESTTNEHEAAAFTSKAQALMAKHSISAAVIAAANGTEEEGGIICVRFGITGSYGSRKVGLAATVANHTGCKGCFTDQGPDTLGDRGYRYEFEVFGTRADVEWCETLYNSLVAQMDAAIASHTRTQGLRGGSGRRYGTGFVAGFTGKVNERLAAVNSTAVREAQDAAKPGAPSVAVVLASKRARVEEEYRRANPDIRTKNLGGVNSWSAYSAGVDAGSRAAITRGGIPSSNRKAIG